MQKEQVFGILRKAGVPLRKAFGNVKTVRRKKGDASDDVTDLDIATERYISRELLKVDSSAGFCGEETGGQNNLERFWLLDPIDGTSHFVRGLPFCTTMLALVENGSVVFSAIYDFMRNEMYWAEKNKGAWKEGERIYVSNRGLRDAYVGVEADLKHERALRSFVWLQANSVIVQTIDCGFEFAMIAQGKLEGRIAIDPWGKDWDFAPGAFLAKEAGAVVKNFGSESYDFKDHSFFVLNQNTYEDLKAREDFPLHDLIL
ncbi:MAG: inositol monophosphatase family protein [Candidatus Wildermuthbacteria bacterium]|nr:inositol monophosphatase family protein [Candidatus Wildermuthbacteria bacterium]